MRALVNAWADKQLCQRINIATNHLLMMAVRSDIWHHPIIATSSLRSHAD